MDMPKVRLTRQVHQGHVINVRVDRVELSNGHTFDLDIIEHPGAAAVVPIDAEGNIYLVRQPRHAAGKALLEIPAGKLEKGEKPERCAARELEEEAGQRAGHLEALGSIYTTPGFCNERIWLFLATQLTATRQQLDAEEVIIVERMPFATAVKMAGSGEIEDAKTICALLRAQTALGGI